MDKQDLYNSHIKESALFNHRLIQLLVFFAIIIIIILARLYDLQILHHKKYSTLSQQNIITIIPLPPARGLIYDRNNILIAKNIPSYNLCLRISQVDNLKATLNRINKIIPLSSSDIKKFYRSLSQHQHYETVPLKLKLNEMQIAAFYVNRYQLPGASIQVNLIRQYPEGRFLSPVLGYVSRINSNDLTNLDQANYRATNFIGKIGIEKYYEHFLHGKVGSAIAEIDASGHIIRYLNKTPAVSGEDLHLSIDSKLQEYAFRMMQHNNGAIVAIDPNNGEVLAMVSTPSYDPNPFVTGISSKAYQKLLAAPNHPLYNRSIRGLYSPGSTIKPFYAIAALSQHYITRASKIFDPGWFRLAHTQHIYHDWKRNGHGWVNITKAITVSCDTFFYQLAVQMGIKEVDSILHQFGFGNTTGIDIGEEVAGTVPSPHWKLTHQQHPWYTGDTIITGIGQGSLLVTPLQLAVGTAILAEHGQHIQPHLLRYTSLDGNKTTYAPVIDPAIYQHQHAAWHTVIAAMERVIYAPRGTAINFGKRTGYIAAGKTGTAQVYGKSRDEEYSRTNIPKKLRNNHLFIVFAPVKHPTIALAIVVEHAGEVDGIARKILDFYLHGDQPPNKKRHV